MKNTYDNCYNNIINLNGSKWTSLKTKKGWHHFEVFSFSKKTQTVSMFAVCDKKIILTIKKPELKNKGKWKRGWVKNVKI